MSINLIVQCVAGHVVWLLSCSIQVFFVMYSPTCMLRSDMKVSEVNYEQLESAKILTRDVVARFEEVRKNRQQLFQVSNNWVGSFGGCLSVFLVQQFQFRP